MKDNKCKTRTPTMHTWPTKNIFSILQHSAKRLPFSPTLGQPSFVSFDRPYIAAEPPLLSPVKKRIKETSSPTRPSNNSTVVVPDSPASIITISSDSDEEHLDSGRSKPPADVARMQQRKESGRTQHHDNRKTEYNGKPVCVCV